MYFASELKMGLDCHWWIWGEGEESAVFGKFWQNRMLVPALEGWRPHLGEILDPPLIVVQKIIKANRKDSS